MNSQRTVALVRLSAELSTKARGTRRRFMRRLVENIRNALSSSSAEFKIESQWTRLYIRTDGPPESLDILSQIAGVSSHSIVLATCPADLDLIVATGTELFAERIRGRSFAVRPRRTGDHPFSSADVARRLGSALNAGATVDLTNPDVEVHVEVRDQDTYFFEGRTDGLGGLPLGVEGRAVCLLSGGFDSAVAAWMMLKRGVQLDYVFCNLAGEAYERSVAQVAKVLGDQWSFGTRPRLHVVQFAAVLDDLRAHAEPKYWQLVLKRLMYRAAEQVAVDAQDRAQAIITGESIGQVSSQTLANLTAIDRSTNLPVFRPLIGLDKLDIIDLSRRVGTYALSSKVKEYCAIAPGNPATSATPRETEVEHLKLDPAILREAVAQRRVIDVRRLRPADLALPYLIVDNLPDEAVVVDVRSEEEWDAWHFPGSIRRDLWTVTENPRAMDRERTYIFYCDAGVRSVQAAEAMQQEGYEAYAFRGGTARIRKQLEDAIA